MIKEIIKRLLNRVVYTLLRQPFFFNRLADIMAKNPELFFNLTNSPSIVKAAKYQRSFIMEVLKDESFIESNMGYFIDQDHHLFKKIVGNPELLKTLFDKYKGKNSEDDLLVLIHDIIAMASLNAEDPEYVELYDTLLFVAKQSIDVDKRSDIKESVSRKFFNSSRDAGALIRKVSKAEINRVTKIWLSEYLSHQNQTTINIELLKRWTKICSIFQPDATQLQAANSYILNQDKNKEPLKLVDLFSAVFPEKRVKLFGQDFHFVDHRMFLTIVEEILEMEEYWFSTDVSAPYILDCGSNIGLSIIYFKSLFPDAEIIGFEPIEELRTICEQNIKSYELDNVTVKPVALAGTEGKTQIVVNENVLANSLEGRRPQLDNALVNKVTIKTETLSRYISDRKIDFLKMDIEGAEFEVLQELGDKLKLVQGLFCEYHIDNAEDAKLFPEFLTMLTQAGFTYNISTSPWVSTNRSIKPYKFLGKSYSISIVAKQLNMC